MTDIITSDVTAATQDLAAIDQDIATAAARIGAVIRALLKECAPTINRTQRSPNLTSDDCGRGERATWSGIRFAGEKSRRHTGQSGTWQWSIYGQSAYISIDGTVHLVDWDGCATDFDGCAGYMDTYTSEVTSDTLEHHLALNPDSAPEIVAALRTAVTEDKRAAAGRLARITEIIANLR